MDSAGDSPSPFFLNPTDSQLLFSSPSLSPPILSPIPHLTPSRFLTVSGVPPSNSSAINSSLRIPHPNDDASSVLSFNRLQILPCPSQNSVLLFFPTGTNLDQIGYLVLSTGLQVIGDVTVARERFFSRILKILVQPSSTVGLGYVMVYSLYSIHCYFVNYEDKPVLRFIGYKRFKSSSIVNASWSSNVPGECLVLLENGEVFVFVLNQIHCGRLRASKLKISWEGHGNKKSWLGCEFGWRNGIFIVARSDAVFAITERSGNCSVRSLLEVESLNMDIKEFVGFAKAGSDSFRFIIASRSYVFLCDERSRVPLLKWQHYVERPCFINVFELGVDESSCVVIGSFWNAQSQMFCYGEDHSSLYVRELPHNILLPNRKCLCGACKIGEVTMKKCFSEWVDWQKKRVLVLGFCVLDKYQSSGFTLVRLTSSGKLEAVKFRASRGSSKSLQVVSHIDSADEVNLLYLPDDEEYKLPKRFKYLDLGYFSAHIKGILTEFLGSNMKSKPPGSNQKKSFSLKCHEELCEKLNICGFGKDRHSSITTAVFDNINSPTSVFDISLRETWSSLPIELLLLAFSNYSEFKDVLLNKKKPSLEFLVVPEVPQLPPFFLRKPSSRSSKWSKREQPGVELVGPVVPLPVLLTLHEFRNVSHSEREFSPEAELSNRCNRISKVTREVANLGVNETTISLGEDEDMEFNSESQKEKKAFIAYRPITKTADSNRQQEELTRFVSRVRHCNNDDDGKKAGLEWFSDMSPVEICFEERAVDFDKKALHTSKTLLAQWQHRSSSYQEFLSQYHLRR